jgi:hypothetical protein
VFHPLIGVNLGIQPSACPSHRGGVEVQHQRMIAFAGALERLIYVSDPIDSHAGIELRAGRLVVTKKILLLIFVCNNLRGDTRAKLLVAKVLRAKYSKR